MGMFGRRRAPASIVAGTDASPLRFALGYLLTANTNRMRPLRAPERSMPDDELDPYTVRRPCFEDWLV